MTLAAQEADNPMARKVNPPPTLDQAAAWLRDHGFEVAPESTGEIRVSKHGCVTVLATGPSFSDPKKFPRRAVIVERPAVLLGGRPAQIVDRGYQKFLKSDALEVTATAAHLRALHHFQEELAQAIGRDQIYNTALGTVSDEYLYDRLKGRADIQP
jgi:hypothetical protein